MGRRAVGNWFQANGLLLGLLGLAGVCLAPALKTGYWAEDIYYSAMIPASPILRQSSWLTETWLSIQGSIDVGRFYPITPIITAIAFRLFPHVVAYKSYILGMTLLDLILYHALIRQLTGRPKFAAVAVACTIALFQFRLTVDPLLAYYGQIQGVIAALFVSLICLVRWFEAGKTRWLAASVLAYFGCTLAYEMTYPLVLLPLWLIARRLGWRRGIGAALPFVAAVGSSAGMTVLVRQLHPSSNYVHTTDLSLSRTALALAQQISAGLPLSYYLGDPLHLFGQGHDPGRWVAWVLEPGVILIFLAAVAVNLAICRWPDMPGPAPGAVVDSVTLGGLGVLLATAPAVLTGISPYHRNYLSFGVGWIGVMVQYYGVGLLLSLGIERWLAGRGDTPRGRVWSSVTAVVLGGVVGLTYRVNSEVATAMNAPAGSVRYRQFAADHGTAWHTQRLNLIAAIAAGVLDNVPDASRVELAHQYPYWHDTTYGQFFYTKETGKRIETFPSVLPTRLSATAPLFRVRDVVRDRRTGLVSVVPISGQADRTAAAQGRLYVRHPALPNLAEVELVADFAAPESAPPLRLRLGKDLPTIQMGRGWGLFVIDPTNLRWNVDSLRFQPTMRPIAP